MRAGVIHTHFAFGVHGGRVRAIVNTVQTAGKSGSAWARRVVSSTEKLAGLAPRGERQLFCPLRPWRDIPLKTAKNPPATGFLCGDVPDRALERQDAAAENRWDALRAHRAVEEAGELAALELQKLREEDKLTPDLVLPLAFRKSARCIASIRVLLPVSVGPPMSVREGSKSTFNSRCSRQLRRVMEIRHPQMDPHSKEVPDNTPAWPHSAGVLARRVKTHPPPSQTSGQLK